MAEPQLMERLSFWSVVKASALKRLGKPLLLWYAVLLAIGAFVVLASLIAMRFSP